jgi:hypothetical protein
MEQEIRATTLPAAKTGKASPPRMLSSLARPVSSLPLFSPAGHLCSTATAVAETEGRLKLIPPPGRKGVGGGERDMWVRSAIPVPLPIENGIPGEGRLYKGRLYIRIMMKFLQQLFSESGEASFSRLGAFVALTFACGWITYLVLRTHILPSLEGLTFFIAALYGLGKANETLQRLFGGK